MKKAAFAILLTCACVKPMPEPTNYSHHANYDIPLQIQYTQDWTEQEIHQQLETTLWTSTCGHICYVQSIQPNNHIPQDIDSLETYWSIPRPPGAVTIYFVRSIYNDYAGLADTTPGCRLAIFISKNAWKVHDGLTAAHEIGHALTKQHEHDTDDSLIMSLGSWRSNGFTDDQCRRIADTCEQCAEEWAGRD